MNLGGADSPAETTHKEGTVSVLELCATEVAAVPIEASAAEAIRMMLECHVGAVAVVDTEQRIAGIFTERDVLLKLALSGRDLEKTPVKEDTVISIIPAIVPKPNIKR